MTPTLTLDHVYGAFRDSVRFYPRQSLKCQWPQTFRVFQLSLGSEISTPNLGATICDKDKPYFFSRLWQEKAYTPNAIEFDFPLLYAFELPGTLREPFGKMQLVHQLEIGVWDVLSDNSAARKCVGCDARTINEIHRDTHQILLNCLYFAAGMAWYKIDGADAGLYNRQFIQQGLDDGQFTTAEKIGPPVFDVSAVLNKSVAFERLERSDQRYGTKITLQIQTDACPDPTWNFETADFGIVAAEAGCKNC